MPYLSNLFEIVLLPCLSSRFVKFLEEKSPADGGSEMSLVFESLVQKFLNVEQYANDIRYVNYCMKWVSLTETVQYFAAVIQTIKTSLEHVFIVTLVFQASYFPDPIAVYSHIYSKGIGSRTAALYVAWAQQFEQRGMNEQADAMYQKAMENQAQPADTVLNEYR